MTRIARANPLTTIGAALLVALVLLLSLDVVTAATALVIELALVPLAGIPLRRLARRFLPLAAAAVLLSPTAALYGEDSGRVYLSFGIAQVSDGSLLNALAVGLRLLAIGLPAAVLVTDLDATRLADGLGQRLHLPDRFVLAGLAGVRLLEVLGEDWRTIALARRARGVADSGRVARLRGQAFALLVVALRRATTLATAMEARALGAPIRRTWSRPSTFGTADVVVVAAGLLVALGSVAAGLAAGTYRLVFV